MFPLDTSEIGIVEVAGAVYGFECAESGRLPLTLLKQSMPGLVNGPVEVMVVDHADHPGEN
jgi:hypothetical protein